MLIIFNFISCSRTYNINLSKKEVRNLPVVYQQKYNGKLFDSEWIFFQNNICQYKIIFIREQVYTGTWSEKRDTITANFFYKKKMLKERKLLIDKSNNKLREISN